MVVRNSQTSTRVVRETGLVEYVCVHGVSHPDPESVRRMSEEDGTLSEDYTWGVHGCDGCCLREDFPGRGKVES